MLKVSKEAITRGNNLEYKKEKIPNIKEIKTFYRSLPNKYKENSLDINFSSKGTS